MSSGGKVRFGVIGCGDIANAGYMPLINDLGELVATCDVIEDRARRSMQAWGAKDFYSDPRGVVDRDDVDAVVVCSAHQGHGEQAEAVAEAGKHLLVQKPMAASMDVADRIVAHVERTGVKVISEPAPQLRPTYKKAKELLDSGAIGRPLYFLASEAMGRPAFGEFYLKKGGGGPLYGVGVYQFAALTWLLGPARRVVGCAAKGLQELMLVSPQVQTEAISADGYAQPWSKNPPRDYRVEQEARENTFTNLYFDNDVIGSVIANYLTFYGAAPRGLTLFGTEGALTLAGAKSLVLSTKAGNEEFSYDDPEPEHSITSRCRYALRGLIDCIQNDTEPVPSAQWGRHICEIMIRSEQSAEEGRFIDLVTKF